MSPLWRDRILVSLAPDSVALARIRAGLRPRIASKRVIDCDPAFGAEPWQGAIAALASAIEPVRPERVDVTVVLSNHFVRYAMVPFDATISGPEEELALARFYFTRIHGERARTWDLRLTSGSHGAARLASAVDTALIEAIRSCFPRKGRARLVSVQPYLMSASNHWHGAQDKQSAWLLLVEPRRICVALPDARSWKLVQTFRGEFSGPEDWATLLDRQELITDASSIPRTVFVHAPASRRLTARETRGWTFLGLTLPPLEGFLPLEDGKLAMALTSR